MIHKGIQGEGLARDQARGRGHADEFVRLGVDPVQLGRFAGLIFDLDGAGKGLRLSLGKGGEGGQVDQKKKRSQ